MSTQSRAKSQEMRQARAEAEQRRKKRQRLLTGIGVVVILALVAAIVFVVVRAATGDDPKSGGSGGAVVTPSSANAEGGVPVGAEGAPVNLTIYYDYMCPACGAFEQANGAEIDRALEEGTAQVELRPISFLDRTSQGTRYSTRSANAFATVADKAPEQVWEFHQALYANQPQEGTTGLSDEQIASIARDAGVPDDVVEEFPDLRYEAWVAEITENAFDSGITGTPTVLIDGKPFEGDMYSPGALSEAIEAAAEK